jgi:hypothetical protein
MPKKNDITSGVLLAAEQKYSTFRGEHLINV